MKPFTAKYQNASEGRLTAPKAVKWVEVATDDIKIVIDGSKTSSLLRITVEANGIRYMLTDSLLEMMLGKVAEEYSTNFLAFNVCEIDG